MPIKYLLYPLLAIFGGFFFIAWPSQNKENTLTFAICADYPPFEYYSSGDLSGFDIALAKAVALELGKEADFKDMSFSALFPALQNAIVDAVISTVTITPERAKNFDFSNPYYIESIAVLYDKNHSIHSIDDLDNKKMACQLGTTMEIWLKAHTTKTQILAMDSNPSAVEALKAGHVDGVVIDTVQAIAFSRRNPQLGYHILAKSDTGYAIAFKKGSPLVEKVNKVLEKFKENGMLESLMQQYMESFND